MRIAARGPAALGRRWALAAAFVGGAFALTSFGAQTALAQELVYFYEEGCPYCEAWDEDIGSMYHKTWESQRFPLRKLRLSEGAPADLGLDRSVQFTPTFVLVDADGQEISRIAGYNSEWFWAFLGKLIQDYDARRIAEGHAVPSPSPCEQPGAC